LIDDKNKIKQLSHTLEDKTEYLLDNYVYRPLSIGITDAFVKLLKVMRNIPDYNPLFIESSSLLKSDDGETHDDEITININAAKVGDKTSGN